jgi:solute carrier family 25 carnitine/acylcarnitine transporter 20/29
MANQYVIGGISGMCGILISHPLDTIKTHIQTNNKLNSFKPSFTNFYKGISAPLLGVGLEKAIVFGTYNYMLSNTNNIPLSGAISGIVASFIVTPYERLKILKQNSQSFTIKDVINHRFLFKGLGATFTREMPGFAIYFSVYEHLKKQNFTKQNKEITGLASFLFGGLSGITAWLFIYPQDRIKTIIQSSNSSNSVTNPINSLTNPYKILNNIYKEKGFINGLKYFYTGFNWALGRAMLLHSGTFFMVETLNGKIALDTIY